MFWRHLLRTVRRVRAGSGRDACRSRVEAGDASAGGMSACASAVEAMLEIGALPPQPCEIYNMSVGGALLELSQGVRLGEPATLHIDGFGPVRGHVARVTSTVMALAFEGWRRAGARGLHRAPHDRPRRARETSPGTVRLTAASLNIPTPDPTAAAGTPPPGNRSPAATSAAGACGAGRSPKSPRPAAHSPAARRAACPP